MKTFIKIKQTEYTGGVLSQKSNQKFKPFT